MAIASKFPNTFPSLNLDFAKTKELDPRVTFTRASTATFVDSTGALRTAQANQARFTHDPLTGECLGLLIEEQRTNLLTYSDQFDNAAWTKSNSFIQTNQIRNNTMVGAVAGTPGTLPTNWTFQFNTTTGLTSSVIGTGVDNGISYLDFQIQGTASGAGSFDIFLENANSVPALTGQAWTGSLYWKIQSGSITGLSNPTFRLYEYASGVIYVKAQVGSIAVPTTNNLTEQRTSRTFTLDGGATVAFVRPLIKVDIANGAAVDITLRIGMPQLVQGATAGDVVATSGTAAPVTYTDPFNAKTAMKLVENTANNLHFIFRSGATSTNTTYTLSVYAKAAERTQIDLRIGGVGWTTSPVMVVNLSNGTIISGTGTVQSVGNGWYRCSILATSDGTVATRGILIAPASGGASSYTGDGTSGIYITDAQLEAGAFPTSYIPTTVSTVTRSADTASITGTNFSQWYNQGEGTVYAEAVSFRPTTDTTRVVAVSDGTANNSIRFNAASSSAFISSNNNTEASFSLPLLSNLFNKWSIAYKTNDANAAINGVTGTTDTSVSLPLVNRVEIGALGGGTSGSLLVGTIKSIRYYPERLSNEQIQALTS